MRPHTNTPAAIPPHTLAAAIVGLTTACGLAAAPAAAQDSDQPRIGLLEIEGTPAEAPNPYAWLFGDERPTLAAVARTIRTAPGERDLDHLVVRLKDAALSWSQVDELGQAIAQADVPVHVFAEQMGPADFMLAAAADNVLMQRAGDVSLPGMYMEEMFLADTLGWIGMDAQLVQVGDYKGANEQLTRSEPSEAWDENISQLLDGLYGHMLSSIARRPGLNPQDVERAMADLWLANADDAKDAGLIDSAVDLPAISAAVAPDAPSPRWVTIEAGSDGVELDTSNPFAMFQVLAQKPTVQLSEPTIAVLHLTGTIITGDSTSGGLFGGQSIGSRSVRNILKELGEEDMVKGVVLRISSPGGSATASEIIWQGVRELRQTKPVWVSVGDMAASGGYYIAVAGEKIYANPSSIVGSIGVVGGKISMGELYDTLRINVVGRARGPRADMFASGSAWNDRQLDLIRGKMREVYDQFTDRVAAGRPGIDLSKTAEGRLFVGKDAAPLRMVDEVGSLHDAVADLADELGLESYDVRPYPGPKSLEDFFEEALGGMAMADAPLGTVGTLGGAPPMLRAARAIVGERAWDQLVAPLEAMSLLREEPVVLTVPRALLFR